MGRCVRTTLPLTDEKLIPRWPYLQKFRQQNQGYKEKQKQAFDRRHRAQQLPALPDDTAVWVSTDGDPVQGRIVSSADTPRSYLVDTTSGQLRRNRHHLMIVPDSPPMSEPPQVNKQSEPTRIMTRSQTGTPIIHPKRLA